MQRLLITNIGNRNILYNGKSFAQLSRAELKDSKITFREWTENILSNFEEEKINIQLNILQPLLEKLHEQFDVLILFYSDQETHNHQDTIYMAELIKKLLLLENVPYEVELRKIYGSVIDNNSLLRFYRNQLNSLNSLFDNPFYFLCDAGGTPQCKSALKISAEFVLEQDRFKVYYVNPDRSIHEVSTDEYRSIINMEQAIILIQQNEYLSALNLLGKNLVEAVNSKFLVEKLLAHLHLRKNGHYKKAASHLDKFRKRDLEKNEILRKTHNGMALGSNIGMKDFLGVGFYNDMVEKLYVIILYKAQKNYTELILKFSVFYESLLTKIMEVKYGYSLYSDFYNASKSFVDDCNSGKINIEWEKTLLVGEKEVKGATVPVMLEFLKRDNDKIIRPIIEALMKFFPAKRNRRINILRNNITHRGEFVDEELMKRRAPVDFFKTLDELIDLFQLEYDNIYYELGQSVISELRSTRK